MENEHVIIMSRVSTDEQAEKGHSIKQQDESLTSFCKKMQHDVVMNYKEDHSAKDFNRPKWKELKAFVKANKNLVTKILFTKWDRFSRNIEQAYIVLSEFRKMGIEINAIEQPLDFSNPNYKIMLAVYLAQSEMERDNISDRTSKGTRQAKKDGYYCGRAPYGYDNHRDEFKKPILKSNDKSVFVKMAFEDVAKGIEPVEEIRKRLTKSGMTLQKSAFSVMLKNIVYAAKVVVPEYQKEPMKTVDGKFEPIIDLNTFYKVQDVFRGKRWHGLKSHINYDFPMRDFLTCEICGRQITGSISKGRSNKYGYYHCRNKCKTRVSIGNTHSFVSNLLTDIQINENVKELFKDILTDVDSQYNGNRTKQLENALNNQKKINENIIQAEDMLLRNEIQSDRFNSIVNRLNTDLMKINNEIEVLSLNSGSIKEYVRDGLELLANLDRVFLESDYDGKRILAGSLFNEKLLFGNNGCRTAKTNKVVELLTRFNKVSEKTKKEKAAFLGDFSVTVPRAGVEPARFPTGV